MVSLNRKWAGLARMGLGPSSPIQFKISNFPLRANNMDHELFLFGLSLFFLGLSDYPCFNEIQCDHRPNKHTCALSTVQIQIQAHRPPATFIPLPDYSSN